ncbi:hypothetical protein UFOVP83_31 [uncultured Caudovirales phage]|uniref:DUF559 domain-containing protein n=1 Tax=uncultured Caudovirales phage TaxID=2100421 RepID=A0A6J5TBB1_9CAUD|nr:hypothetical protein UFOVP83_31 [uncultured Caudovirales phage]
MKASSLEETLAVQLRALKIPFEREVVGLVEGRRFRVDFLIHKRLVVECQGGIWTKGGHSSGAGISRDCEKFAELLCAGYPVIPCTMQQIKAGTVIEWIQRAIENLQLERLSHEPNQ